MLDSVSLLKKLLSFKSITPYEGGSFEFIKKYLGDFNAVEININNVKNLYLYKEFQKNKIHLCFGGHLDVVPPGNGWNSNPFIPEEKDGYIFGRGSQDMKAGIAAFLNAVKDLKTFAGKISLILTSDEEGDAKFGTIKVLEYLKKNNDLPDFAVVAEPTCEKFFGDTIKIGRRGSINGVLKVFGKGGHAAYPQKAINPVHQIAPLLEKIAGVDLDDGDEFFDPSKIVITDIRGGLEVTNVTPSEVKIMFNVRNSTKTDKKKIKDYINKIFKGLNFSLTLNQSAKPFLTNASSLVVSNMQKAVQEVTNIKADLNCKGGTSDARFFGEFGIDTVEFGVRNDTIHAPNERVKIDEVQKLEAIFKKFLKYF